jgi:hypothetical protein
VEAGVEAALVLAPVGKMPAMDRPERLLDPVTEVECVDLRIEHAIGFSTLNAWPVR